MVLGLPAGEVRLLDAHQAWADEFELEKAHIIDAVGDYIREIQHVGSTAIPGVPAKPVLDILVGVDRFEEAGACIAPLGKLGYFHRHEYGIPRRHYFVKGDPRTHHLHMVERDSHHWAMTMAFRDFLRRDAASARAYAEAKRSLAARYPQDRAAYQRGKDEVIAGLLASAAALPHEAAVQLLESGFTVIPGPSIPGGHARLSSAYDHVVATADPCDIRVSSSTRVNDIVNRTSEFDGIYVFPPLLAACELVMDEPYKLSGTCLRTLSPFAAAQDLHVDVRYQTDDWPMVGFILMVDAFDRDSGATRFVPRSHLSAHAPDDNPGTHDASTDVLACGPPGSLIIFNGSVWHGYSENRTDRQRRSVQGHFIPRRGRAALDYQARMRPETAARIGDVARHVLGISS